MTRYLDHFVALAANGRSQARAVGAGAFDSERDDGAERRGPVQQFFEPLPVGGDAHRVGHATGGVEDRRDVDVFVGVDADDDESGSL